MKADWTADDIPDLTGKVSLVTGASAGLGVYISGQLAKNGSTVIMAARKEAKAKAMKLQLERELALSAKQLDVMVVDISEFDSVKKFALEFKRKYQRLDHLIANAGVMALNPVQRNSSGFEMQMATNHLGHFLLVGELLELLKSTDGSTLVLQSSKTHWLGSFDWENLNAEKGYSPWGQYGMAKLANVTFANELARRLQESGVSSPRVNSCHPGQVGTELQGKANVGLIERLFMRLLVALGGTLESGSLPALFAATSPEAEASKFYGPCHFTTLRGEHPRDQQANSLSHDPETMKKLWEATEQMLGYKFIV